MSKKRETLINISNGLIQTGALYELCETEGMRRIVLYLTSISINGKIEPDIFNMYSRFYENKLIAATAKRETIMKRCHLKDEETFWKNLRRLEDKGYIRERVRVAHRAYKTYSQNAYVIGYWYRYGNYQLGTVDERKIWKQLYLMDDFYKMYPEREPGND
jgi:hypothetical protein